MGDITRSATVSIDAFSEGRKISGLVAGEALTAGHSVYMKSDGYVWKTSASSLYTGEQAKFLGMVAKSASAGDPVTVFGAGCRFDYSSAMTIGTHLFVSNTSGSLTDTAVTFTVTGSAANVPVSDRPVAVAISATDIVLLR